MVKFPKTVWLRYESPDDDDGFFVVEESLSSDLDGEVLGEYRLVESRQLMASTTFQWKPVREKRKAKK